MSLSVAMMLGHYAGGTCSTAFASKWIKGIRGAYSQFAEVRMGQSWQVVATMAYLCYGVYTMVCTFKHYAVTVPMSDSTSPVWVVLLAHSVTLFLRWAP